ncbi:exonuclease domain-containing protein [Bifidobacterium aemilianum]|nr:exonuclease domain-containing protein [Bifidobacterium aemilianum]
MQAIDKAPAQGSDTLLCDSQLLGFDTETTGTRAGKDAIVSASLVLRDPAAGYQGDVVGEWIINPHCAMNPKASQVNGFTDEFLAQHGEEPTEAVDQVARIIDAAQTKRIPLLAYNACFDIDMLSADLKRWGLAPLAEPLVVDPLVIDRAISKRSGRRTLEYTTQYYGVEPHGDFHDARADTVAAVDLIKPMSTLYPQVGKISLDELMQWQRSAFETWKESFNEWLSSKGRRPVTDTWL